jgi:hypothetical protein
LYRHKKQLRRGLINKRKALNLLMFFEKVSKEFNTLLKLNILGFIFLLTPGIFNSKNIV